MSDEKEIEIRVDERGMPVEEDRAAFMEMVAPWKSIMMARLKSGLIASFWHSPQPNILATPEVLVYSPYIK